MNGTLYIGGRVADCDGEALALFTYRREDLDNPTVVRNSYSQQIRLKGTPANDAIFGHFVQGTRITGATGFDAAARTPFILYGNGGEVLESGYCKLDTIERAGASVTYLVTLYGGMGDILYKLSAADDGTPLTLADLDYGVSLSFYLNRSTVFTAWEVLANNTSDDRFEVVNFAHTYDPLPADFDASKLFCLGDDVAQVPPRDAGTLGTDEAVLISMDDTENKMDALQVGDFRSYLQRPVIRVLHILTAIGRLCTAEGWTLNLDADFFKSQNAYYSQAWMTLPFWSTLKIEQGDQVTKAALLSGTMSPLSFLVGYCRHFGLVITANHIGKTLDIRTRKTYYDSTLPKLDLSGRIHSAETQTTTPLTFDARWYLLGDEPVGGLATDYGQKYRTPYGMLRIDTGYAFNDEARTVLDGQPFKGGAMRQLLAIGPDTFYLDGQPDQYRIPAAFYALGATSPVVAHWQLARAHTVGETWQGPVVTGPRDYPGYTEAMLDMSSADGKIVDDFVLLFFDGIHEAEDPDALPASYYISDDNPTLFDTYAGGKRCWLACGTTVTAIPYWPRFSRWIADHNGEQALIAEMLDYNQPAENYCPGYDYSDSSSLFVNFWAAYLGDRFDIDAKVVKVKANIHGLPRPAELLRRFVWWDGALWSVNAVQDWDPLGDGLTTLELVRVKDPANYRQ